MESHTQSGLRDSQQHAYLEVLLRGQKCPLKGVAWNGDVRSFEPLDLETFGIAAKKRAVSSSVFCVILTCRMW